MVRAGQASMDASRIEALMSVYLAPHKLHGERAHGMGGARSTAASVLIHTSVDLV